MPKIYTKANVQNNNPATPVSAGTMAIFDNGIDALDTKAQNLPEDGSFDPNSKADLLYVVQELNKKMNVSDFEGGEIDLSSKADITYVDTELAKKVSIETGKSLMLDTDKSKLDGIEAGAEVNNISDASATNLTSGGNSTLHYHSSDRNVDNHVSGTNNKVFTATDKINLDGYQEQINGKQATITGGATTIASSNLTASRALVSDASGKVAVSAVTSTEVGYLDGVTSAIQTQLNAKAPLASPSLTGTPTAPTAAVGTNTTQLATTAFVSSEIANDATRKSASTGTTINYIWSGTQAQYDAIGTKDAYTLYFIV